MNDIRPTAVVSAKPLYLQVKESLVLRLVDGSWRPGQLIPSETELARQLGVSQGTVRRALAEMTADHLLVRQQGRGTLVAVPEEGRGHLRRLHIRSDRGDPAEADIRILFRDLATADEKERKALQLEAGAEVFRIHRLHIVESTPLLIETVSVPASRFQGFDEMAEVPPNIHLLLSEIWGTTVSRTSEELRAIAAANDDAAALGCPVATPLLKIIRVARDLEDRPVELRVSRCLTAGHYYRIEA